VIVGLTIPAGSGFKGSKKYAMIEQVKEQNRSKYDTYDEQD